MLPLLCELAVEMQPEYVVFFKHTYHFYLVFTPIKFEFTLIYREEATDVNHDLHADADYLAQLHLPCVPLNEQRLLRTVEILEVVRE